MRLLPMLKNTYLKDLQYQIGESGTGDYTLPPIPELQVTYDGIRNAISAPEKSQGMYSRLV